MTTLQSTVSTITDYSSITPITYKFADVETKM